MPCHRIDSADRARFQDHTPRDGPFASSLKNLHIAIELGMETSRSLPDSGLQGRGLRKVANFFGFAHKKNASRSKTPTNRSERQQSHPTAYAGDVAGVSEVLQRHSAPASRVEPADREGETGTSYDLPTNLKDHFDLGRALGHGGNAVVVRAVSRHTGKEFACKCISKVHLCPCTSMLLCCFDVAQISVISSMNCLYLHKRVSLPHLGTAMLLPA